MQNGYKLDSQGCHIRNILRGYFPSVRNFIRVEGYSLVFCVGGVNLRFRAAETNRNNSVDRMRVNPYIRLD